VRELPRKLISLWEIMKRIYPHTFLHLGGLVESASFKLRLPVNEYAKDQLTPGHPKELMPKDQQQNAAVIFDLWEAECRELELVASLATVRRLQMVVSKPACEYREVDELLVEFHSRLEDETKLRYFWALDTDEGEIYADWSKGWEKVIARFPETTRDIEEMNKCFALSRYTAAIFHAMQIAELAAIELGDYIGVVDPKKGWGPTQKKLAELLKQGHSKLPSSLSGKFEFLEQMSREVDSMVLAWRHKVDHAANRLAILPNTDFTPDIAEHIIGSVRIFMLRLQEGM
jgi:hypothetical protein